MKTGFTASSFDLFHAGHAMMLEDCKKHCDYLIVGLNVSPENKSAVQGVFERYTVIKSIRHVDEVIPYGSEQELVQILTSRKIDVRFLGEDYVGKHYTGEELKIPVVYNSRRHGFSSSALFEKISTMQAYKKKK
jgi:glycerol-3-phosphate cytidylyltransferase